MLDKKIKTKSKSWLINIDKIEEHLRLKDEIYAGYIKYLPFTSNYFESLSSPKKGVDLFVYGQIYVEKKGELIMNIIKNNSNCQLCTIERFDTFMAQYPVKNKGIEKLSLLLKAVGKPHYLFHVTQSYVKYIEKLCENYEDFELVYKNKIDTYASKQVHILVRCTYGKYEEDLENY